MFADVDALGESDPLVCHPALTGCTFLGMTCPLNKEHLSTARTTSPTKIPERKKNGLYSAGCIFKYIRFFSVLLINNLFTCWFQVRPYIFWSRMSFLCCCLDWRLCLKKPEIMAVLRSEFFSHYHLNNKHSKSGPRIRIIPI